MSRSPSITGRTLGEFVVGELLGRGGFGDIYRAFQPSLQREAVIKVARSDSEEAARRFLREARLAAQIDHPDIAHVYAFGVETEGLLWLAMELVRGTPLDALIRTHGALRLDRFVPMFERLCEVVHAAHACGIVHRDIKPANIIIVSHAGRWTPKLIDLGVATWMQPGNEGSTRPAALAEPGITRDDQIVGTPLYMAPEQWSAAPVDARTDVYALGIVAFECLTGHPPFSGELRVLEQLHRAGTPPALSAALPAALTLELQVALAKAPDARHATALAFATKVRDASGVARQVLDVPRLPADLVASIVARAPRPIADAIAHVDAATTLRQLRTATARASRTIVRYIAALGLAGRGALARAAAPLDDASPLLEQLARRALTDEEWLKLPALLCAPLLELRNAFAIPELLDFLTGAVPGRSALALLVRNLAATPTTDDASEHRALARLLADLAATLAGLAFLDDYTLTVGAPWMGTSRTLCYEAPAEPALLRGVGGETVLDLGPLVRVAAPMPGAPVELFVFAGRGARGAIMVSASGYELADDAALSWLGEHLLVGDRRDGAIDGSSPYRGLAPLALGDADRFFGRDAELATFRNRLRTTALLAIAGSSGVGKSSFAIAGVAADLAGEWHTYIVRPGPSPLATLASAIPGLVLDDLSRDPRALGTALRALAASEPRTGGDGRGSLLVVDQLEELFTQCRDDGERLAFARALSSASIAATAPVRVVLTIRDDFLSRAHELPGVGDLIAAGVFLLATPSARELHHVITEPSRRAGYAFDDADLPARIVDDVAGRSGALALLAFAMAKLWDLRDPQFRVLRASAYSAMGGVGGAFVRHVDATYASFTATDQARIRDMFMALVTAEGTRASLARADAVRIAGERVLEALVTNRLLAIRDGEHFELAHEALITQWPRLVAWREDERINTRLRDQSREAARAWSDRGRPPGLLWRGDALADLERWLHSTKPALTEAEQAFVTASRREARASRRRRRLLLGAVALVLATTAAVVVVLQLRAAEERARSDSLAQNVTDQRALSLFVRAQGELQSGNPQLAAVDIARSIELGRDTPGSRLLLADALRSLRATKAILRGHTGAVWAVAASVDRTEFATAGDGGEIRVWSRDGRPLHVLRGHADRVYALAALPDGRLVSGSGDRSARVWERNGSAQLTLDAGGLVLQVAGTDDRIVTVADGFIRVWNARDGERVGSVPFQLGFDGPGVALTDGIAYIASDHEPHVYAIDLRTGVARSLLEGSNVVRLAVSSRELVAASSDGTLHVISLLDHTQIDLHGNTVRPYSIALSKDGRRVAVGDHAGRVELWDLAKHQRIAMAAIARSPISAIEFSPAGNRVALASAEGAYVIDGMTALPLARLDGHDGKVWALTFVDDTALVTAGWDHDVRIWNPEPQRLVNELELGVYSDKEFGSDLPIASAAGRERWLVGGARGAAILDAHSGRPDEWVIRDVEVSAAAWASTGTLAYGDVNGRVTLRPPSGKARTFDVSNGIVTNVAFSPSGSILAAGIFRGPTFAVDIATLDKRNVSSNGYDGIVAWSGSDLLAAVQPDGAVAVYGPDRRLSVHSVVGGASRLRFEGDTLWIGSTTGLVVGLDALGRRQEYRGHDAMITQLITTPTSTIAASNDGTALIWDLDGTTRATLRGHDGPVLDAAMIGVLIATIGDDGTLRVWDTTGSEILRIPAHAQGGRRVGIARDRVVSTGADGYARVWRAELDARAIGDVQAEIRCRSAVALNDHDAHVRADPCGECLSSGSEVALRCAP